nr:uncharacterized mitochondrial protein AtMg00810-like [Aegilops tauschii subsp. strangulata]
MSSAVLAVSSCRASMLNYKPIATPADTKAKLSATSGDPAPDPSLFCSLAGALQYLMLTRPDIAYAVQQVCLVMHFLRTPHVALLKCSLRYLRGTMHLGLHLRPSTSSQLVAYTDADWAGCPNTGRSTSGYRMYLDDNLVSWSSKRQATVSRSSSEAEYRAVANAVAESFRHWDNHDEINFQFMGNKTGHTNVFELRIYSRVFADTTGKE